MRAPSGSSVDPARAAARNERCLGTDLRSPILLRHREQLLARQRPQPGLCDRCDTADEGNGALRAADLLEVRVADEDAHKEWRLWPREDELLVCCRC